MNFKALYPLNFYELFWIGNDMVHNPHNTMTIDEWI